MTTAKYNARMSERGKSRFASSDRRYVRRRLEALGRLDTDGQRHARRERYRVTLDRSHVKRTGSSAGDCGIVAMLAAALHGKGGRGR